MDAKGWHNHVWSSLWSWWEYSQDIDWHLRIHVLLVQVLHMAKTLVMVIVDNKVYLAWVYGSKRKGVAFKYLYCSGNYGHFASDFHC